MVLPTDKRNRDEIVIGVVEVTSKKQKVDTQATPSTTSLDIQNQEITSVFNEGLNKLNQAINDIKSVVDKGFESVNERLNSLESRVAILERPTVTHSIPRVALGSMPSTAIPPTVTSSRHPAANLSGQNYNILTPQSFHALYKTPNQAWQAAMSNVANGATGITATAPMHQLPSQTPPMGMTSRSINPDSEVLQKAEQLFRAQKYIQAIDEYNKLGTFISYYDTNLPFCYFHLAHSLMAKGDHRQAIGHLEKVYPSIPRDTSLRVRVHQNLMKDTITTLGICHEKLREFPTALEYFYALKSIPLTSDRISTILQKIEYCEAEMKKEAASASSSGSSQISNNVNTVITKSTSSSTSIITAYSSISNNNSISSANVNETIIDLAMSPLSTHPSINNNSTSSNEDESFPIFMPDRVPIKVEAAIATEIDLAEQLYSEKKYEEAITQYLKAENVDLRQTHLAHCYFDFAGSLALQGRHQDAILYFGKITSDISSKTFCVSALFGLAQCHYRLGHYAIARNYYRKYHSKVDECNASVQEKVRCKISSSKMIALCESFLWNAAGSTSTIQGNPS